MTNVFTASPTSVRVGDSVSAVWTMTNSSDEELDLAFAPVGPGVFYFLEISAVPENTLLQTVALDVAPLPGNVLTFGPHERRTLHAVFLAAAAGRAEVQACLPPKVNEDDPWQCKSITIDVHN